MRRAVRAILRLIAAGLILFGGLEIGLEWMRRQVDKTGIRTGRCLVGAALIALGVFLFAASARLAERLTDDPDE